MSPNKNAKVVSTQQKGKDTDIIPASTPGNSADNIEKWYKEMEQILGGNGPILHPLPKGHSLAKGGTRRKSRTKSRTKSRRRISK